MRTLRERTSLLFAANTTRRAREDWDEHSRVLAAGIDGDKELAAMLATRHVRRAAETAFARLDLPPAPAPAWTWRQDVAAVRTWRAPACQAASTFSALIAWFTRGITFSAISSIERRPRAPSAQSMPQ